MLTVISLRIIAALAVAMVIHLMRAKRCHSVLTLSAPRRKAKRTYIGA